MKCRRIAGLLLWAAAIPAVADTAPAAVAANFTPTAQALAARFEALTGHRLVISSGSSGKLYTQIVNGAPFDLFLSADEDRPRELEAEGRGLPGTRFTYAVGQLLLWSSDPALVDAEGAVLRSDRFRRLAVANPRTAPYGAAAMAVLRRLGLEERLASRLVQGENIAQAYQFVATGNAELGFVALAQVRAAPGGSAWEVPRDLYPAVEQQAVLLDRGRDNPAARGFLDFLRTPEARALIREAGYGTE